MIKSCSECKNKCCRTGPGPHRKVPVEDYLENFSTTEGYNTECENFGSDGKCKLWGTNGLPYACRVYVCQSRIFSDEELHRISCVVNVEEEDESVYCRSCKSPWYLHHGLSRYECEVCGHTWRWVIKEWDGKKRKEKRNV